MKMEGKTNQTCLDSALQNLEYLLDDLDFLDLTHLESTLNTLKLDLKFFKMFFWTLAYWEEIEYDWHLCSAISTMVSKLSQIVEDLEKNFERQERTKLLNLKQKSYHLDKEMINWEEMRYHLDKTINWCKRHAKESCILLLDGVVKYMYCPQNQELFIEYGREMASFIDFISQNLEALLHSNSDLTAPVKKQIAFIQSNLKGLRRFANPVTHSITRVKNLGELILRTRTWANHISCLACLYWIDGMDESLASTMGTMLDLIHKTMPYAPRIIASHIEDTIIPQLLASYFDFLLEGLVIPMKDDDEILREGLIFLLSFVVDPPEEDSEDREWILSQIYAIINELASLIRSFHFDEMKECIYKAKFSGFLQKIDKVKTEVREQYVMTPHSSNFNSPWTNVIGFLDSLLGTLKRMLEEKVNFTPFTKYQVEIVQEELASLRSFLQRNTELQNEHGELKDLWTRTADVVYYAAYVTNLRFARSFSKWYGIICLPNVIKDIKLIKTKIQKIEDSQMYKNEMESSVALPPPTTTSKLEGVFIGFEEDVRSIIEYLLRGPKDLTIISISGMPGQGKTTLVKKIYNDPKIQYYFHKMAWCYVSKECNAKELLIKIRRDLISDAINLEVEDLAGGLRRILKKQRYLIVMDDIWDVAVWQQVQISFPDDSNGSRILFTSRNEYLASQAKQNSISHPLRLFSKEESWELMKEKLFSGYSEAPPEFLKTAQQITSYCTGLPLAVALIASLLRRTEQKLDLWNKVAENLKQHIASQGCRNMIELSYKYLPDHLKSCFLYFGALPRGRNVRVKILKWLWIAEGFIKVDEMPCSTDLANDYLDNLVSQNLVVVAKRNSMGGIKTCNVHDLLYDFCLEKAKKTDFLNWEEISFAVDRCNSSPQKYSHHRLCLSKPDPFIEPRPICTRKELPTSQVRSLLCSLHYASKCDLETSQTHSFWWSFKVLTVLDFLDVFLTCDRFPEVILSIIHLRYLALCFRDPITDGIPPSIANLWNLETLIVSATKFDDLLPVSLWEMKSLRHVSTSLARFHLADFEENNSSTACNIEILDKVWHISV